MGLKTEWLFGLQLIEGATESEEPVFLVLIVLDLLQGHGEEALDALDERLVHEGGHLLTHVILAELHELLVDHHTAIVCCQ